MPFKVPTSGFIFNLNQWQPRLWEGVTSYLVLVYTPRLMRNCILSDTIGRRWWTQNTGYSRVSDNVLFFSKGLCFLETEPLLRTFNTLSNPFGENNIMCFSSCSFRLKQVRIHFEQHKGISRVWSFVISCSSSIQFRLLWHNINLNYHFK